jgi:hypothetical protein
MTTLAVFAVSMSLVGWLGVRRSEAKHRVDRDLTTYLLTIPNSEWKL